MWQFVFPSSSPSASGPQRAWRWAGTSTGGLGTAVPVPLTLRGQDADQLVSSSLSCHCPALFGHLKAGEEKRWWNAGSKVGMGAEVFAFLLQLAHFLNYQKPNRPFFKRRKTVN